MELLYSADTREEKRGDKRRGGESLTYEIHQHGTVWRGIAWYGAVGQVGAGFDDLSE